MGAALVLPSKSSVSPHLKVKRKGQPEKQAITMQYRAVNARLPALRSPPLQRPVLKYLVPQPIASLARQEPLYTQLYPLQ